MCNRIDVEMDFTKSELSDLSSRQQVRGRANYSVIFKEYEKRVKIAV